MATEPISVSKISAPLTKDLLESLRSPKVTAKFVEQPPERSSITESDFNDIALDDDPFSPVALTSRQSSDSDSSDRHRDGNNEDNGRPLELPLSEAVFNPSKQFSHKKSASNTTIRSSKNLSFLFTRLDLQEESSRGSADGQQKLQEEFDRLHKEEEEMKKNVAATSAIDWGASFDSVARSLV